MGIAKQDRLRVMDVWRDDVGKPQYSSQQQADPGMSGRS